MILLGSRFVRWPGRASLALAWVALCGAPACDGATSSESGRALDASPPHSEPADAAGASADAADRDTSPSLPPDASDGSEGDTDAGPDASPADAGRADSGRADASDVVEVPLEPLPAASGPRGVACVRDPACRRTMVVAHRGIHDGLPENSIASIREAGRLGLDFAEVDIRQTADGVLVALHDGTVQRTTDGRGEVAEMTLDEVRALRLRGALDDDPETWAVPTFEEVLDAAAAWEIDLYVDWKTGDPDVFARTVGEAHAARCLMRGGLERVTALWELLPGVEPLIPVRDAGSVAAAREAIDTLRIVEISATTVRPELLEEIRGAGLRSQQDVMAGGDLFYRTGDTSGWASFVDAGVDVLQSDLPDALVRYLATRERW